MGVCSCFFLILIFGNFQMDVIYLFILFIPNKLFAYIYKRKNKKKKLNEKSGKTDVFMYYIFMYFK